MTEADIASIGDSSLAAAIDRAGAIQSRYGISALRPLLDACRAALEQPDVIDVGIFGRFKAGKSSLLNLLSGKPVLPVGVTPVTSIVTRLRYGVSEIATVRYIGGGMEKVSVDSVQRFVSEAENHGNARKVDSVTVELPSLKPYQGLQFVDTPGMESVFSNNMATALDWLPNVGLALVTVGVDPPLSRQDVELIRTLRGYTPRIVIVLTKTDLVSDEERNQITAFIQESLRREFKSDFRIFPVSVRPMKESMKHALDRDLLFPLGESRDSARAEIVSFKFKELVGRMRDYLLIAQAAAERAEADRSDLKNRILNLRTGLESIRMELRALARECAGRTRPWIMDRMRVLFPDVKRRVTIGIEARLFGLQANLWELSRAYESWLETSMQAELAEISVRESECFRMPLEKARLTLSRALEGFRDRLASNVERVLGVRLPVESFDIEAGRPRASHAATGSLFMFNTDLLWFIIPMTVFRPWVEKHFLGRISEEVWRNLSRLAAQWTEAVNAAILKMQREAEKRVEDQITTVESLLSRTHSDVGEIVAALKEIDKLGRQIV